MYLQYSNVAAPFIDPGSDDRKNWGIRLAEWREGSGKSSAETAQLFVGKKLTAQDITSFEKGQFRDNTLEDVKKFLKSSFDSPFASLYT